MNDKIRTKEMEDFERKWGVVCPKCKLRKTTFNSIGHNLPNSSSICQCKNDNK